MQNADGLLCSDFKLVYKQVNRCRYCCGHQSDESCTSGSVVQDNTSHLMPGVESINSDTLCLYDLLIDSGINNLVYFKLQAECLYISSKGKYGHSR